MITMIPIMALAGLGIGFIALGSLSMLMVAKVILSIDKTLSQGKYSDVPSSEWVKNVGLLMITMIPFMALAGVSIGFVALGSLSMLMIVNTILSIDKTLSKGKYNDFPSLKMGG